MTETRNEELFFIHFIFAVLRKLTFNFKYTQKQRTNLADGA